MHVTHENLPAISTELAQTHISNITDDNLLEISQRTNEFLSIISHELKTPLTAIKGNIQLAQLQLKKAVEDVIPSGDLANKLEAVHSLLERADRQIGLQNRLVDDLLDVSRIQANKLELHIKPCNLVNILHETIQDQLQAFPMRTLHLEVPSEIAVLVIVDVDRIQQVLINYLTNALKYSPANSPIEVRLWTENQLAYVSVRDEGPGLSAAEQQRIWERFYRVPGIQVQSGTGIGLGLGLHICKTIIERHHGQVGVQSTPGHGSTFWFTLPLKR